MGVRAGLLSIIFASFVLGAQSLRQWDNLNVYYCPEDTCVQPRKDKLVEAAQELIDSEGGLAVNSSDVDDIGDVFVPDIFRVGAAVAFVECSDQSDPQEWNPIYNGGLEEEDLVCTEVEHETWVAEVCAPAADYVYPSYVEQDGVRMTLAKSCLCPDGEGPSGQVDCGLELLTDLDQDAIAEEIQSNIVQSVGAPEDAQRDPARDATSAASEMGGQSADSHSAPAGLSALALAGIACAMFACVHHMGYD